MNVITIPKKLAQKGDLFLVPRNEYEEFSTWKRALKIRFIRPTATELKAIKNGRQEIKKGKYVEWEKFKQELAYNNR